MKKVFVALVSVLAVSACAPNYGPQPGQKEAVGTLLGAAAGAGLGIALGGNNATQWGLGIAGALLGGAVGNSIGSTLDKVDQNYHSNTYNESMEYYSDGQSGRWVNPNTGHYGSVTPMSTYQNEYGEYCRNFRQTIYVNNYPTEAFGTACRDRMGNWRIVN